MKKLVGCSPTGVLEVMKKQNGDSGPLALSIQSQPRAHSRIVTDHHHDHNTSCTQREGNPRD